MSENNQHNNSYANDALVNVLTESLKQQKRSRRWKALTRVLTLLMFVFIMFSLFKASNTSEFIKGDVSKPHTAVIEIKGTIAEDSFFGNAEHVIESLRKAYKQKNVKGIILDLNSPGGSPVQSDLIYQEIKSLQDNDEQKRKVYAVVSDVCASGCYYLASAADKIYANELSTVGSIGVLFSSFGVEELMKKVGVDRRLQTAGKYKAFLDPFSKETEEGKAIIQQHLSIVHDIFIDRVTKGRNGKLDKNNSDLFSGLFWTGKESLELGLVDDFKNKFDVASNVINAQEMIDYTAKPTVADMLGGNFSKVSMSQPDNGIKLLKKWLASVEFAGLYQFS